MCSPQSILPPPPAILLSIGWPYPEVRGHVSSLYLPTIRLKSISSQMLDSVRPCGNYVDTESGTGPFPMSPPLIFLAGFSISLLFFKNSF